LHYYLALTATSNPKMERAAGSQDYSAPVITVSHPDILKVRHPFCPAPFALSNLYISLYINNCSLFYLLFV
jgi:hypothetical protein